MPARTILLQHFWVIVTHEAQLLVQFRFLSLQSRQQFQVRCALGLYIDGFT